MIAIVYYCLTGVFFFFLCYISVDIDECQSSNLCLDGSTCRNTFGSFECLCATGYQYNRTTDTCTGENYPVNDT